MVCQRFVVSEVMVEEDHRCVRFVNPDGYGVLIDVTGGVYEDSIFTDRGIDAARSLVGREIHSMETDRTGTYHIDDTRVAELYTTKVYTDDSYSKSVDLEWWHTPSWVGYPFGNDEYPRAYPLTMDDDGNVGVQVRSSINVEVKGS
jgi:hypothetical protein